MTVQITDDKIKITLSFHHRQMLRYLAEHGGRATFRFNAKYVAPANHHGPTPTEAEQLAIVKSADDSIRKMEEMGVIKLIPLIGQSLIGQDAQVEMILTDIGRNVIDQMGIVVKQ